MAGELPEVVTRFIADTTAFVADVEKAIASDESFAASAKAVDAAMAEMTASVKEAAAEQLALVDAQGQVTAALDMTRQAQLELFDSEQLATEAATALADAERIAAEAAQLEAEMAADLAAEQRLVRDSSLAAAEAQAAVSKAYMSTSRGIVAVSDEQKASIAVQDESAAAASGAAAAHSKFNKAVLGVGAAMVYSVAKAASFQSEVQRLYTAAGLTGAKMSDVQRQILDVANATGFAGNEIAKAMYHPISAGLNLSQSLQTVANAAKLARIHGADLEDTTYALSSVMKAYDVQAKDVTKTSALLNSIVGQGDMRFQDFNQSIKNWTPTGAAMGISIQSMGAALAYLTDRGNSAEVASTRLTMGLSMVTSGSKAANTYLRDLGLTSGKLSLQNKSLQKTMEDAGLTTNRIAADLRKPDGIYVALQDLQGAFRKSGLSAAQADQVMAKIFGGGRSDKAILSLMSNLDGVRQKYDSIGQAVGNYGSAWSKTQQTTTQQWHQTVSEVKNLAIEIGTTLLPAVNSALGSINKLFGGILGNKTVLSVLKAVVPAIIAVVTAMKIMTIAGAALDAVLDANPISLIVIALAALVAGLIYAYNHVTWFRNGVNATLHGLAVAWSAIWHGMQAIARWFAATVLPWLQARLKVFSDWWKQHGEQVKQVAKETWDVVSKIVEVAIKIWWDTYLKPTLTIMIAAWKLAWGIVRDVVSLAWHVIYDYVALGVHSVLDIIAIILDVITGKWGKAWNDMKKLAGDIFHGIVKLITDIASGFGNLLYDAGKNVIQGLINGIESMASGVSNAMSSITSMISGFLPHSPAKWGPLAGSGDPQLAGAEIANRLAGGMAGNTRVVTDAANRLAAAGVIGGHHRSPQQKELRHLQTLFTRAQRGERRYQHDEDTWRARYEKYHREYLQHHHSARYARAQAHALAEIRRYAALAKQQEDLYKRYHGQYESILHPHVPHMPGVPARLAHRPEYRAAQAAQAALQAMRQGPVASWGAGGLGAGVGSGGSTVVQHVVNVTVEGSVRSDRDLVAMLQTALLRGRKSTTLPTGR